jgi:hypothetical protein
MILCTLIVAIANLFDFIPYLGDLVSEFLLGPYMALGCPW